jgi:hypothetical protein
MSRQKTPRGTEVKGPFEALVRRQGGKGSCGSEEAAEEGARRTKLAQLAERIAAYDHGYEGGRIEAGTCPPV